MFGIVRVSSKGSPRVAKKQEQLRSIAERLLAGTDAGSVTWESGDVPGTVIWRGSYGVVSLSSLSTDVWARTFADGVSVDVLDSRGEVVVSYTTKYGPLAGITNANSVFPDRVELDEMIRSLYNAAVHQVEQPDERLDDILRELGEE